MSHTRATYYLFGRTVNWNDTVNDEHINQMHAELMQNPCLRRDIKTFASAGALQGCTRDEILYEHYGWREEFLCELYEGIPYTLLARVKSSEITKCIEMMAQCHLGAVEDQFEQSLAKLAGHNLDETDSSIMYAFKQLMIYLVVQRQIYRDSYNDGYCDAISYIFDVLDNTLLRPHDERVDWCIATKLYCILYDFIEDINKFPWKRGGILQRIYESNHLLAVPTVTLIVEDSDHEE